MISVVGDAGVDRVHRVQSLEVGKTTIAESWKVLPAGGSANSAAYAAYAGAEVNLFASIGNDEAAAVLRAGTEQIPNLTTHFTELNEPTQTSVVIVDATGERTIVVCPQTFVARPTPADKAIVTASDVLLVNVEVASIRREWAAFSPGLHVLPCAHLEAEITSPQRWDVIVGSLDDHARPTDAELLAVDARVCLMTDGARGGWAWDVTAGWTKWASPATNVVDSIGAGDAFLGGVLVGCQHSMDSTSLIKSGVQLAVRSLAKNGSWPV